MVRIVDLMQNTATPKTPSITYNTHGKVRPLNPTGYMVNSSLLDAPVEYVKDFGKDLVFLKNGLTGKSNDHELGRLNDFSMKIGGLALAAYLFKKNTNSMSKLMEFAGVASFFGMMALWPKLFIQLPIKLMHGVDIHKKFVDSEGRKKMFFQDPQYIPWDILTHKEIEQLGDRMGIPKTVHHRQGITKENAQRIAVQGNTLWMWTAGFAAPLGSSLICNGIEKFLSPKITEFAKNRADSAFSAMQKGTLREFKPSANTKALNKFLATQQGQPVTKSTLSKISNFLMSSDYIQLNPAINKEVNAILSGGVIDRAAIDKLNALSGHLDNFSGNLGILQNYSRIYRGHVLADSFNNTMDTLFNGLKDVKLNETELAQFAEPKHGFFSKLTNGIKSLFGKGGISEKEILAKGGDKAVDLIMFKLQKVAQTGNEAKFEKLVVDLSKAIEKFDGTFTEDFKTGFEKLVKNLGENFSGTYNHIGEAIKGHNKESLANTMGKCLGEQVTGARGCLYKIFQVLDLEKRISSGELRRQFNNLPGKDAVSYEEVVKLARQILKRKTISDYMQKFNVTPDTYRTASRLLYGVEYGANAGQLVFDPSIIGNGSTVQPIVSAGFRSRVAGFFKAVKDKVMSFENLLRLNHNLGNGKGVASPTEKHLLVGAPVEDLINGAFKRHFNANKWLKITGIAAGTLIGATLLTEALFIGKAKIHKKDKKK